LKDIILKKRKEKERRGKRRGEKRRRKKERKCFKCSGNPVSLSFCRPVVFKL
jgi:hypothetical protein